jgi:predicted secreted protein
MPWYSALAIYILFWVVCGFVVLPIGVRTSDELGEDKVPGQADSAPANFRPGRVLLGTTALSGLLFGLFYLNFTYRWIEVLAFSRT